MIDPVLMRFALAVLAFILFEAFIKFFVKNPKAKDIFTGILLFGCVLYVLFGQFLPW